MATFIHNAFQLSANEIVANVSLCLLSRLILPPFNRFVSIQRLLYCFSFVFRVPNYKIKHTDKLLSEMKLDRAAFVFGSFSSVIDFFHMKSLDFKILPRRVGRRDFSRLLELFVCFVAVFFWVLVLLLCGVFFVGNVWCVVHLRWRELWN